MGVLVFMLVFIGLCIAGLLVIAVICFGKRSPQPILGTLSLLSVIVCLVLFAGISHSVLDAGSPVTKIALGTHKVGFVYLAGENVSVGIEKAREKEESLFLYQFPKKDFEGEIKAGAKKLTAYQLVTGDGTFNKYKLE